MWKKVDRLQLEQLVDRIGKESCELMQYRLKNKKDNSRKLLYFLRIGITNGLHSFAAPRLLYKKGLFVELPTQSNCPRLQLETDEIRLLIKSVGKKEVGNLDPPCYDDQENKGQEEQAGARANDKDPQEQSKPLNNLESEMIENIVRTISGEDKQKITQRLHRSIRNCISTYITNASLLLYSNLDSANTGTDPQQEDDDMIVDMINNADTPPQPGSVVANCNIEQEDTLKNLLSKHFTGRNRAFTIERHNGKDTDVVACPSSKDPTSFVWGGRS
jgi:hypothetical protein